MKKLLTLLLSALLTCSLCACGGQPAETAETAELFAMNTVMKLTAYGDGAEEAVAQSQREINRLEQLLSRTLPASEISRINAANGQPVAVSEEVYALLSAAQEYSAATTGAFDPTIAPVVSAWGFTEETQRVPTETELADLLTCVGQEHLTLAGGTATLTPGAAIDLGGIAKGYASDRVAEIFAQCGVSSGVVSLGGNVYVRGSKPDGTPWRVAIQDPAAEGGESSVFDPSQSGGYLGTLLLEDAFAITSGGYQRYFEQNGTIYHHIIDPSTGMPAHSGLTSVTVVGNRGAQCDAYSTALFVLGEEKALELWRQSGGAFSLILATEDGRLLVTEDLRDSFQVEEDNGYACTFVS